MAKNPFVVSTDLQVAEQQIRRERVKVTVYTVLGCLVALCLTLLFQGCRTHQPAAENPMANAATATPGGI